MVICQDQSSESDRFRGKTQVIVQIKVEMKLKTWVVFLCSLSSSGEISPTDLIGNEKFELNRVMLDSRLFVPS